VKADPDDIRMLAEELLGTADRIADTVTTIRNLANAALENLGLAEAADGGERDVLIAEAGGCLLAVETDVLEPLLALHELLGES